ncbi:MAG TPA: stage II sporulation protein D [Bacillaceae bacterium]|nr:stage II sporulation protein D [Bacillaceae bacterium]
MKQMKPIFVIAAILIVLTFTLPSLLVLPTNKGKTNGKLAENHGGQEITFADSGTEVAVFRTESKEIEKYPLEEYVVGVVAAEMPAEFELEALKAQALAARTYIVNHLLNGKAEGLPEGANIMDTVDHQVFLNQEDMKKNWGDDYEKNLRKIRTAVKATEGEILTYNNMPITASFFSTSNGYTENADEYWKNQIPYLVSVESPWDSDSPKFTSKTEIPIKVFEEKLGVKLEDKKDIGTITSRTTGKKVATVKIGGKEFTGREIREKLDLRSTDFKWVRKDDKIVITTTGYGHGVGMSQYGANGMAKDGKTYKDIVNHYYSNISISEVNQYSEQILASK